MGAVQSANDVISSVYRRTLLPAAVLALLTMVSATLGASEPDAMDSSAIQAWRAFTAELEAAGVAVLRDYPQPHAIDEAEALPYLLQQLSTAITRTMIRQPGQPPLLRVDATTINKWALDGADVKYLIAPVDGQRRYLLRGKAGDVRLFAVQAVRMAAPYASFDSLTGDQLPVDENGHFEIMVSKDRPQDWTGPWLPMREGTDYLLLREYFADWDVEAPGTYTLDDLQAPQTAPLTMATAEGMLVY